MRIEIQGRRVSGLSRSALRQILESVLDDESCPEHLGLSVKLTGDDEISQLHQKWMGIDGPTDVLSFPMDDPKDTAIQEGCLGDVVVSVDTAARQASDYGVLLESEVILLAVHGTLHLLGYDDHDPVEREKMRRQEKKYVPSAFNGQAAREREIIS